MHFKYFSNFFFQTSVQIKIAAQIEDKEMDMAIHKTSPTVDQLIKSLDQILSRGRDLEAILVIDKEKRFFVFFKN